MPFVDVNDVTVLTRSIFPSREGIREERHDSGHQNRDAVPPSLPSLQSAQQLIHARIPRDDPKHRGGGDVRAVRGQRELLGRVFDR